jgi:hypothetical protein
MYLMSVSRINDNTALSNVFNECLMFMPGSSHVKNILQQLRS